MSFSFVKTCPECGDDFQESVESCPDCGTPLLVKPPDTDQPIGMEAAFFERRSAGRPAPAEPLPASPALETVVETTLEHTKGLMGELADAGVRFRVDRLAPPDTRSLSPAFGIPADAGSYAVRVAASDLAVAREVWKRYFEAQVPGGFAEAREGSCPGCGAVLAAGRSECPSCGLVVG